MGGELLRSRRRNWQLFRLGSPAVPAARRPRPDPPERALLAKAREGLDRLAGSTKAVDDGVGVGVAEGDAADHRLVVRHRELAADERMELGDRGLRAGVQAEAARRHHDALQEHAVVEPRAELEAAIDGEHHADRGAEELVVGGAVGAALLALAAGDAEGAVESPAAGALACEIRLED